MKFQLSALIGLICLQSHATIIQQQVVVDAPVVSVRAGEQQNGNLAIEQLFTNNTTSAQDSLSSSFIPVADSPNFGGSAQRGAPSAFNSFAENIDTPVPPPVITPEIPPLVPPVTPPIKPPVDPITPAVPEPETYALMAMGLSGLLLARRKRTKSNTNQL